MEGEGIFALIKTTLLITRVIPLLLQSISHSLTVHARFSYSPPHRSSSFIYLNNLLSYFASRYQPIPIMTTPNTMVTVLTIVSAENRQVITIPVPAPVKKSITDFSRFNVHIALLLFFQSVLLFHLDYIKISAK